MVFVNENWNNTNEIVIYSNYHKYWLDRERKIKNPLFDVYSGKILDLKACMKATGCFRGSFALVFRNKI